MSKLNRQQIKLRARNKRIRREKHERRSQPEFSVPSPAVLERVLRSLESPIDEQDPRQQAQELAYQAMEAESLYEGLECALLALSLDPQCVDALTLLAYAASTSRHELIPALRKAVEAGERSLGRQFFRQNRGHFWGIVETRPYMRARFDLACALMQDGFLTEAIAHFESLIELNPNDNQGVRDILMSCYLSIQDLEGTRRLLERYAGDSGAVFAWSRVLERYLATDLDGALAALQDARADNPHVQAYLTGAKRLPKDSPSYYTPGEETEAFYCAGCLRKAWLKYPQAVSWLRAAVSGP